MNHSWASSLSEQTSRSLPDLTVNRSENTYFTHLIDQFRLAIGKAMTDSPNQYTLTLAQKLRLSTSVFLIYWPLRIYLNVSPDHLGWHVGLVWLVEIPFTILLFTLWLSVTEWLMERLFRRSQPDFLIDVNLPAQLMTLLVAGALAIAFNLGFHYVLERLDTLVGFPRLSPPAGPIAGLSDVNRMVVRQLQGALRDKANNGLTILAMLMAFYLAANRRGYQALALLRVNAEQLKRLVAQAQFVALRNQVNPHFLFNSLSILSSLVDVDPKLSIRFIRQLATVYRYILEQRETEQVSLQTELAFLDAYCFLLTIRFADRLQVRTEIDSTTATRFGIAPLTLQLLVENAVKHNQMSTEQPLVVTIAVEGDYLRVSNPIQRRPQPDDSTGLGFPNIINRYRLLTDRPVQVTEAHNQFTVGLPLLT